MLLLGEPTLEESSFAREMEGGEALIFLILRQRNWLSWQSLKLE